MWKKPSQMFSSTSTSYSRFSEWPLSRVKRQRVGDCGADDVSVEPNWILTCPMRANATWTYVFVDCFEPNWILCRVQWVQMQPELDPIDRKLAAVLWNPFYLVAGQWSSKITFKPCSLKSLSFSSICRFTPCAPASEFYGWLGNAQINTGFLSVGLGSPNIFFLECLECWLCLKFQARLVYA